MKVKKLIRRKQRVKEGCLEKRGKLKGLIGIENPQLVLNMTHGHDACNAATKQLIRRGGTPCAIEKRKKKRVKRAPHIPTTIPTLDDLGIGGEGGGGCS